MAQAPQRQTASQYVVQERFQRVSDLFGGDDILQQPVRTSMEAHELIRQGIPAEALRHLFANTTLQEEVVLKALGMSLRTVQRRRSAPDQPLNLEQSGRTWKFAETLARATALFGSLEEAEAWLQRPAMALDGRRPLELIETPAGLEMVDDLLTQLEYGVYV